MEKIPTLFKRDFEHSHGRYVTEEITPGCEWVFDEEGTATRKYDGTCVMYDGEKWWARREVKPDSAPPAGFVALGTDDTTGKTIGYEPIEQSGFYKFWQEAVSTSDDWIPGTYELCGPKVNGNPEGYSTHELVQHEYADVLGPSEPITYQSLHDWLTSPEFIYEGIVWHHPDGRMAKIKKRDFPKVSDV
jgi:hypothetical protein